VHSALEFALAIGPPRELSTWSLGHQWSMESSQLDSQNRQHRAAMRPRTTALAACVVACVGLQPVHSLTNATDGTIPTAPRE
jgi:hypothetical protein